MYTYGALAKPSITMTCHRYWHCYDFYDDGNVKSVGNCDGDVYDNVA